VLALISWEWALLMGFTDVKQRAAIALVFLVGVLLFTRTVPQLQPFTLAALLLVAYGIKLYPMGARYWLSRWVVFPFGMLMCSMFYYSAMVLKQVQIGEKPSYYLLYVMVLVWSADIAAYFVGKRWGKHRLIPRVSPGKSVEGLIGGLAASVLIAAIFKLLFPFLTMTWSIWLSIALAVSLASVVGDLQISMLKRQQGLKDTGAWLPGHGGILDRIDSLIPAVILFAAFIRMWS